MEINHKNNLNDEKAVDSSNNDEFKLSNKDIINAKNESISIQNKNGRENAVKKMLYKKNDFKLYELLFSTWFVLLFSVVSLLFSSVMFSISLLDNTLS